MLNLSLTHLLIVPKFKVQDRPNAAGAWAVIAQLETGCIQFNELTLMIEE